MPKPRTPEGLRADIRRWAALGLSQVGIAAATGVARETVRDILHAEPVAPAREQDGPKLLTLQEFESARATPGTNQGRGEQVRRVEKTAWRLLDLWARLREQVSSSRSVVFRYDLVRDHKEGTSPGFGFDAFRPITDEKEVVARKKKKSPNPFTGPTMKVFVKSGGRGNQEPYKPSDSLCWCLDFEMALRILTKGQYAALASWYKNKTDDPWSFEPAPPLATRRLVSECARRGIR